MRHCATHLTLGHVRVQSNKRSGLSVPSERNGILPTTITISGSLRESHSCSFSLHLPPFFLTTTSRSAQLELHPTDIRVLVHCHRHEILVATPLHPCRHQPNLPFPSALGCVSLACTSPCGHRRKQILFSIADKNSYSPGHGPLSSAPVLG